MSRSRIKAGNLYVNRNIIGAVVGVQPFGGAACPAPARRPAARSISAAWCTTPPVPPQHSSVHTDPALLDFAYWLDGKGAEDAGAERARDSAASRRSGSTTELAGPVGERNLYALHPRGRILLVPQTEEGLYRQLAAVLATGNRVSIDTASGLEDIACRRCRQPSPPASPAPPTGRRTCPLPAR